MSDLVKRLRKGVRRLDKKPADNNEAERRLQIEAADRIEALEAEVARLRSLAEKWVMTLEMAYENSNGEEGYYDWQDALAALKGETP